MGKSMQGAGGTLVLGAVFNSILERTKMSPIVRDQFPERWLKNSFTELQRIFESFNGSMLISLVIGLVDEENGMFYYINAEHPWTVLYRDKKAEFIENELLFRKLGTQGLFSKIFIKTFQLMPGDVIISGTDGRDDLLLGQDENKARIIQENENEFLFRVEEGEGNLMNIFKGLTNIGEITDDLALIKIYYNPDVESEMEKRKQLYEQNGDELKEKIQNASTAYRSRNYKEAIGLLEEVLNIDKSNSHALKLLLQSCLNTKEYKKAIKYLNIYTNIKPMNNHLLFVGAFCYKKLRDYKLAADWGERFLLREPYNVENLINLSQIYLRVRNFSRCEELLERIFKVEPKNSKALKIKDIIDKEKIEA
jgi:tetratricopeptide (TPR) repeat protein